MLIEPHTHLCLEDVWCEDVTSGTQTLSYWPQGSLYDTFIPYVTFSSYDEYWTPTHAAPLCAILKEYSLFNTDVPHTEENRFRHVMQYEVRPWSGFQFSQGDNAWYVFYHGDVIVAQAPEELEQKLRRYCRYVAAKNTAQVQLLTLRKEVDA